MSILMRPIEAGDLGALTELYEQVYHRRRSPAYFHWKYLSALPYYPGPRLLTAWDGACMVASAGMLVHPFWCDGRMQLAASIGEQQALASHRRQGLVRALQAQLFSDLAARGARLALALPTEHAVALAKHTGYIQPYRVSWYLRPTAAWRIWGGRATSGRVVRETDAIDKDSEIVWARVRDAIPACVVPCADWLNFRYTKNPSGNYTYLVAEDAQGPCGTMVLGEKNIGKHLDLVVATYYVRPDDPETLAALLGKAVAIARVAGHKHLRTLVPDSAPRAKDWRSWGFSKVPHGFAFSVHPIGAIAPPTPVLSPDEFAVQLGDHDLI